MKTPDANEAIDWHKHLRSLPNDTGSMARIFGRIVLLILGLALLWLAVAFVFFWSAFSDHFVM